NAESRPSPHRAPEERAPRGALAGPPTGSHDGLASVAALFARGRTSMPGDASRRALAPRLLVPSSALLWGLHSSLLSPALALADPRHALRCLHGGHRLVARDLQRRRLRRLAGAARLGGPPPHLPADAPGRRGADDRAGGGARRGEHPAGGDGRAGGARRTGRARHHDALRTPAG